MPNVLVVTSSMRMLNWVHSHTTHLRPTIPLHPELVVSIPSLKEGLLSSPSTRNLPNHRPTPTWNNLLRTRRKLDPRGVVIGVVADNNSIVAGGPSEDAAVTDVVFDIANDGTFGDGSEGEDVADDEGGFLAAVDELAGVDAFGGDEKFGLLLVAEGVAECDLGERGTATWVVDDVGDHAFQVTVSFPEVQAAEPRRTLAVVGV